MTAIKLVIGDRLGKGQKVGAGAEAAGATVTVIPGMAADMKLGDVMNKEQADLGISFCGSGGAGAITAQTKYGYKCRYGMRSIEEGVTAINEGCVVLGFGFMDKEELGADILNQILTKAHKAETDIYELVAELKGCTVEEAKGVDIVEFVQEIAKDKAFLAVFTSAVKSKLQG